MSLGERKRNALFEEPLEKNKDEPANSQQLDSRFVIEPREPAGKQPNRPLLGDGERPAEETGWKPKGKGKIQLKEEEKDYLEEGFIAKKALDPRFAKELAPQKLPPEAYDFDEPDPPDPPPIPEEFEEEDWDTPPVYGPQPPEQKEEKSQIALENSPNLETQWRPQRKTPEFPVELEEKPEKEAEKQPQARGDLGRLDRKHDIFFQGSEPQEFREVLTQVQEYISVNYATLITDNPDDAKEQMLRYISKFIQDNKVCVEGRTSEELLEELYTEMAEYGFLTKYVFGTGIEEIDINAWNDIEVQYSGGKTEKLKERFDSPDHAINVIRRMLQSAGIVLDNSQPVVLGHLSKNIRIAVMKTPIVDEDVGVSASIRIVNPQSMEKSDFVRGGTATENMLDFLSVCIRYGVSICVAGATSSGKTTVLGWLLTTIPHFKRVYTIESGSRELDLVRMDEEGNVVNSVIHTLTRDSDNDKQKVDQIALLDVALRFNPDIVVVGEMRGPEANASQEAARTGVAVLTTIHANSARATYTRMISLCKRAVDMGDETLYQYVTEAYPIIVFCKQLENGSRRMMEIMECIIEKEGNRVYKTLFQYIITENKIEDGKFVIEGEHKQINPISQQLAKRFLENGMPLSEIKQWTEVTA